MHTLEIAMKTVLGSNAVNVKERKKCAKKPGTSTKVAVMIVMMEQCEEI